MMDVIAEHRPVALNKTLISSLLLLVSQRCNMKCIYCYGDGGTYGDESMMSRETAFRAIDWLMERSGKLTRLSVGFFGGEPLLNFNLIRDAVSYAELKGHEKGKKFTFGITTNATLITKEVIDFFKEKSFIPSISFDGPALIHNRQRPFKNGERSYEKSVPVIRMLLKEIPASGCIATLMDGTNPDTVIRALRNLGFKKIISRPATLKPTVSRDFSLLKLKLKTDSERLINAVENQDTDQLRFIAETTMLINVARLILNQGSNPPGCQAGKKSFAVSTSGNIFPCHRFVGMQKFWLGNIYDQEFYPAFFPRDDKIGSSACGLCPMISLCRCFYENHNATGNIHNPPADWCNYMVKLFVTVEKMLIQIGEEGKKFLRNEKFLNIA